MSPDDTSIPAGNNQKRLHVAFRNICNGKRGLQKQINVIRLRPRFYSLPRGGDKHHVTVLAEDQQLQQPRSDKSLHQVDSG